MYGYAQPRALSATALFYVAAVLRSAAYRVLAAAKRFDAMPSQDAAEPGATVACDACCAGTDDTHELRELGRLNVHVLRDIGAPHHLVAHATAEPDREHLRWIALENR